MFGYLLAFIYQKFKAIDRYIESFIKGHLEILVIVDFGCYIHR